MDGRERRRETHLNQGESDMQSENSRGFSTMSWKDDPVKVFSMNGEKRERENGGLFRRERGRKREMEEVRDRESTLSPSLSLLASIDSH